MRRCGLFARGPAQSGFKPGGAVPDRQARSVASRQSSERRSAPRLRGESHVYRVAKVTFVVTARRSANKPTHLGDAQRPPISRIEGPIDLRACQDEGSDPIGAATAPHSTKKTAQAPRTGGGKNKRLLELAATRYRLRARRPRRPSMTTGLTPRRRPRASERTVSSPVPPGIDGSPA